MSVNLISNNMLNFGNFKPYQKSEGTDKISYDDLINFEADKVKDLLEGLNRKREDLTDEQLKLLRDKYSGKDMTQDVYQSFLSDLADMGIITDEEKSLLGGKNENDPQGLTRVNFMFTTAIVSDASSEYSYMPVYFSSLRKDADIKDWIKFRATCDSQYYIGKKVYESNEDKLFKYISDIFHDISK